MINLIYQIDFFQVMGNKVKKKTATTKAPYKLIGTQIILVYSTIFAIIVLDQLTKYLIKTKMYLYQSIPIIKNVFHITYTTNAGAGFGILQHYRWFFILFTVIFLGLVYYTYLTHTRKNKQEPYFNIFIGLLVGGALGNFIDRLRFGFVVDFLDFRIWPTFNLADSAITIAAIGLIIWLWKK